MVLFYDYIFISPPYVYPVSQHNSKLFMCFLQRVKAIFGFDQIHFWENRSVIINTRKIDMPKGSKPSISTSIWQSCHRLSLCILAISVISSRNFTKITPIKMYWGGVKNHESFCLNIILLSKNFQFRCLRDGNFPTAKKTHLRATWCLRKPKLHVLAHYIERHGGTWFHMSHLIFDSFFLNLYNRQLKF